METGTSNLSPAASYRNGRISVNDAGREEASGEFVGAQRKTRGISGWSFGFKREIIGRRREHMNVSRTRTWWVVMVAVCFLASGLRADTIKLKDGSTVAREVPGRHGFRRSPSMRMAISNIIPLPILDSITFGDQVLQPARHHVSQPAPMAALRIAVSSNPSIARQERPGSRRERSCGAHD